MCVIGGEYKYAYLNIYNILNIYMCMHVSEADVGKIYNIQYRDIDRYIYIHIFRSNWTHLRILYRIAINPFTFVTTATTNNNKQKKI